MVCKELINDQIDKFIVFTKYQEGQQRRNVVGVVTNLKIEFMSCIYLQGLFDKFEKANDVLLATFAIVNVMSLKLNVFSYLCVVFII